MSGSDEDTELRDLLVQTLDKNGVLGKLKAELRASVFLALDAYEQNKYQSDLSNPKLQQFLSSADGKICLNVIKDFLKHFHLDYTSSVFEPETNSINSSFSTEELRKSLGQTTNNGLPVLSGLISPKPSISETPTDLQLNSAKEEFSRQSIAVTDSISTFGVTKALTSLCPNFPTSMIKSLVQNEITPGTKVTCDEFLRIYTKLFSVCHSVVMAVNAPLEKSKEEKDYVKQAVGIKPSAGDNKMSESLPTEYLKPGEKSVDLDSSYDQFFDDDIYSKPPHKLPSLPDASKKEKSELDTGSLSKSDHSFGWRNKSPSKTSFERKSDDYEDDFNTTSHASISEDIQADSYISSNHSSLAELTDDRSMQELTLHSVDYMEDIKTT